MTPNHEKPQQVDLQMPFLIYTELGVRPAGPWLTQVAGILTSQFGQKGEITE